MKTNTISESLRERLEKVQSRIKWLENRISRSPAVELMQLRIECQKRLNSFPSNLDALKDKWFSDFISESAKKEKELLKMMNEDESKYWDELWWLKYEEWELKNRIFFEEKE